VTPGPTERADAGPAAAAGPAPGGAAVRWSATTGTTVDTGRWLRRAPLSASLVGNRLVLSAEGPRPFRRVLPATAVRQAVYNHVTGELAFPRGLDSTATGRQAAPAGVTPAGAADLPEFLPGLLPGLLLDPLQARTLLDLVAHESCPVFPLFPGGTFPCSKRSSRAAP